MSKLTNKLNANFDKHVVINTSKLDWLESPAKGVERKPLDRIGLEVARATTIVRYEANSAFPAHTHTGGEEYLVLDGIFSDEDGDHPAGIYVRNPVGSSHAPHTKQGCTIFVKLHQMPKTQTATIVIDTLADEGWTTRSDGIKTKSLFVDDETGELVDIVQMPSESELTGENVVNGEEILVLQGEVEDEFGPTQKALGSDTQMA